MADIRAEQHRHFATVSDAKKTAVWQITSFLRNCQFNATAPFTAVALNLLIELHTAENFSFRGLQFRPRKRTVK